MTAGRQGVIKAWDSANGQALRTIGKHERGIPHFTFDVTHSRLATAGVDGLVKIWDWQSGELVKTLEGHGEKVQSVAFSADGAVLASGSQSCVLVWDAKTLQPLHKLPTAGGGLLAFTPDGQTLLTAPHELPAGQRRAFMRWNVKTGSASATFDAPGSPGLLVSNLSNDGRTVYLMACDASEPSLEVYDAVTGKRRFPSPGHSGQIWTVAFSPDGNLLASAGRDGWICLWDLTLKTSHKEESPARLLTGHINQIWSVAFSPDGKLLASGSKDGTIRLWNVATGQIEQILLGHSTQPSQLAFSPDGEIVAAGNQDGCVNSWDVKSGQQRDPLRGHAGIVRSVAFSPDGRWFASGGADATVHLIDRASGRRVHIFQGSTMFAGLAFSPDSQTLAAACDAPGPSLRLWDVATKTEQTLAGHTGQVLGLAYHPAGNRIATGSWDGTDRLWETASGADQGRVFDFRQIGPCSGVAFSPSGRHLAVGLANGTIAIFTVR